MENINNNNSSSKNKDEDVEKIKFIIIYLIMASSKWESQTIDRRRTRSCTYSNIRTHHMHTIFGCDTRPDYGKVFLHVRPSTFLCYYYSCNCIHFSMKICLKEKRKCISLKKKKKASKENARSSANSCHNCSACIHLLAFLFFHLSDVMMMTMDGVDWLTLALAIIVLDLSCLTLRWYT